MPHPLFDNHHALLDQALAAIACRTHWSPYAENPRSYGEMALDDGLAAFEAYRNAQFYLDQPAVTGRCGGEVSPYGLSLKLTYPRCSPVGLIAAAKAAMLPWVRAGIEARTGLPGNSCLPECRQCRNGLYTHAHHRTEPRPGIPHRRAMRASG